MFNTLIGLEIHVELNTETKMFCGCKNEFGAPPNTNVCEVCLGHPGTMPRLNKQAVEYGIMAALALNCNVNPESFIDRKKYFYPDLPKGYQISQDEHPLASDGYIEIGQGKDEKQIRIERIHLEEDTGKSNHTEEGYTLMDYDRAGVPLIEIVTHPDISSGEEAQEFLRILRQTLRYIGVSDVKMEEGSLRCDVNINLLKGTDATGIVEVKNMNSFSAVGRAIAYEEERQAQLYQEGVIEDKSTRRWDDAQGQTQVMRMEDEDSDYRYSAEPDLKPLFLERDFIDSIRSQVPELPQAKFDRLVREYSIEEYDSDILSRDPHLADYFEEGAKYVKSSPQNLSNWILSDLSRLMNEGEVPSNEITISPAELAKLVDYVEEGKVNTNTGKKLLREIFQEGGEVDVIIEERGLVQVSDTGELEAIVEKVLAENQQSIDDYRAGRDRALGYLMGQCMRESRGQGNPQLFNEMLLARLED